MPIIAIGGAVFGGVMAATDVMAVGLTLTTALEVTAAVGATVAAVGVVTGNKTLTMIGAGLGAIGGIGALASGAGLFGAAGSEALFGPSPAASTAEAAAAPNADVITSLAGQDTTGASMMTGDAGGGSMTAAGDYIPGYAPPPTESAPTIAANWEVNPAAGAATAGGPVADTTTQPITAGGQGVTAPAQSALPPPATSLLNLPPSEFTPASGAVAGNSPSLSGVVATGANPASSSGSGVFSGILDFMHNNQMLSYGALQAGGQFLSGLTSTLTPAQVNALNAQAAANQAAANMTQFQQTNLAGPKPVASLSPVTGTPAPLLTNVPGMINSPTGTPTPQMVNVTGAPT